MKDVALLKVTVLLIVSLQPGGCRMRPSFGGCYVACSGADTLEKLNLGVKQAQCYTPGQHSLRDSQRIDAVRSPHALQHRCEDLAPEWEALPSHLE